MENSEIQGLKLKFLTLNGAWSEARVGIAAFPSLGTLHSTDFLPWLQSKPLLLGFSLSSSQPAETQDETQIKLQTVGFSKGEKCWVEASRGQLASSLIPI